MRKLRIALLSAATLLSVPALAQQSPYDGPPVQYGAFGGTAGSATPVGPAGGDLSGTYPNPTVASIGGDAVSLGGAFTTSGAFTLGLTVSANTSVTLPTTGTLATLAGSEALTNKTYNGNIWTAGTGTLAVGAGKTLTASNTLTLTGTDGSSVAFGAGGTVAYTASSVASITGTAGEITASAATGAVTLSLPTALTFTGKTITGGSYVMPELGVATATSLNGLAITSSTGTLTIANSKTATISNTLTLAGTDGSTLNVGAGGTLASAAFVATGTSGATIPLLNGANTFSGATTFQAAAGGNTTVTNNTSGGANAYSQNTLTNGQRNWREAAVVNAGNTDADFEIGSGIVPGSNVAIKVIGATLVVRLPAIAADTALTDTSVCQDTTNHGLFYGTGVGGLCLGTSSERFKRGIAPVGEGLSAILKLKPVTFYYRPGFGPQNKLMYGFIAEDMVSVLPKLVGRDKEGRVNTADYLGVVPVLVKAMQEQEREIAKLRSEHSADRAQQAALHKQLAAIQQQLRPRLASVSASAK